MEYGGGKENHTKKENVIVFLSNFEVGSEGGDGSLSQTQLIQIGNG
ncbi:hypothetical protein H477_2290 [[Clostridium] sordellii ATCC 9714]|nr:hypothetical protein H477_2290 [[Clostridium] sordellii ATCC 9714] [Paeniclostridium sordellii ATCC 9714]